MDNMDYPSNSKASKKEVKQVATAKVIETKKPLLMRLFGANAKAVGNFVLHDVMIPAAKSTLSDVVSKGIEMFLYGDEPATSRSRGIRQSREISHVSYDSISGRRRERRERPLEQRARSNFDDIVLGTRDEATQVLSDLSGLISAYDVASIADFYDMVGITSEFVDSQFGWDTMGGARVRPTRHGFKLDLPKTIRLD